MRTRVDERRHDTRSAAQAPNYPKCSIIEVFSRCPVCA